MRARTVGGGQATPLANDWNQFLRQQLTGASPNQQNVSNAIAALQHFITQNQNVPGFNSGAAQQRIQQLQGQQGNTGMMDNAQGMPGGAGGQTDFQRLWGQMAGGNPSDPSGAFAALQQMIARGGNTSPQFTNPYTAPEYSNPNINPLSTNLFAGQTGMADLSGIGGVANTNVDVMRGFGGAPATSGFDSNLMSAIARMQAGGGANVGAAATSLDSGMSYTDAYNTLGQDPLMERNRMKAIADQRARFGAEGAGALGTGAQYAEGTLNAELAAQDASRRRAESMQLMGQDLAERTAKANVGLQSAGQGLQASIANAGNSLQSGQSALSALLSGRNQDLQQLLANRGMDISQLGLGLNQAQGNQNTQLQLRGQDLTSRLQNQGLGNNFALSAEEMNQRNAQLNNTNNLTVADMLNRFNLTNAGNTAQYGLGTNQLNASQGQFDQSQLMQAIMAGLGQNNFGQGMQSDLMRMIFSGMQQGNSLGTPQAQSIMEQSPWMQTLQAGMGFAAPWLRGMSAPGSAPSAGMTPVQPINLPPMDWTRIAGSMPTLSYLQ